MKDFVLDLTYKDATIINNNDDIFTTSSSNIPSNTTAHHSVNLNTANLSYTNIHHKNGKFDTYNLIDYF